MAARRRTGIINKNERKQLEAIGYIAPGEPHEPATPPAPKPKPKPKKTAVGNYMKWPQ